MSTLTIDQLLIPSDETIAEVELKLDADQILGLQLHAAGELPHPTDSAEVKDLSTLVTKTFFLRVRYGRLGITRQVPGANVLTTDADVSLLRVSKTLLESNELEAIRKHDSGLRKWLGNTCLPYDIGIMLLPIGLVQPAQEKLTAHKVERDALIEAFISAYPTIKEKAKADLGTLYNETEYPLVSEIRQKFTFEWQYINFGTPGQLMQINPELYKQEQEKAAQQLQTATEEITAVMRETLFEMVSHLKDRLTPGADGKPRKLYDSAITNIKEFLNTFDLRNVTDDKALAAEVQKVRMLLGGTNISTLRSSDEWREKIRKGMENVTDSLSGMVEEKTGRKFREE